MTDRTRFDYSIPQDAGLGLLLAPNFGPAALAHYATLGADPHIEIRYCLIDNGKFQQTFIAAADHDAIAATVAELSPKADVYYGVLARNGQSGKADDCLPTRVAYIDIDITAGLERTMRHPQRPHFVVETSTGKAQVYYDLAEPVEARFVRNMNRRLAHDRGGDLNACDPARIFRVPGTWNYKYEKPMAVRCVYVETPASLPTARDLVGDLPAPPNARDPRPPARVRPIDKSDVLGSIPASVYAPALTGREVNGAGYMCCPWHGGGNERTPSLKCWDDAGDGWNCFAGCGGGDIYSFGAKLWNLDTRRDFPEIKRRLLDALIAAGKGEVA